MKKQTKTLLGIILLIIIAVVVISVIQSNKVKDVNSDVFLQHAGYFEVSEDYKLQEGEIEVKGENGIRVVLRKDGKIKKITVSTYKLKGYDGDGDLIYESAAGPAIIDNIGDALSVLKANGCIESYHVSDPNAGSFWTNMFPTLLTVGIGIVIIVIILKQMKGGAGVTDFGKTKTKANDRVRVRFTDVAGAEEEKEELKEVVDFLKNPKKYSDLGARIPKGVLLVGPPGTGKTLFAKAVAGEAGVPFFSISGSDFVEMFVGVGASRVRDLFNTAKKNQPCIVFIDEIDAVGRQRGAGLGGGNDEREQTLNQLLVQMDGFESNEGIIIMAATNRADVLDPALLRPGRFDRQIYVNVPDVRGREAILKVHARNKPLARDVNFKTLARMTAGFSGADIANLLNEAAILAARENRPAITNGDLYEAINKVIIGPQKKSRVITESDKRITAYHEAGHAILARLLPHCDPVHEVSIIPRGMAAGYTMTRPEDDSSHISKNKLLDDIVMTLGGRVAEEIVIKDISAGASNDINVVTDRARKMVAEWGMSDKIGPVSYGDNQQLFLGRDYQTRTSYSEEKAKLIDAEVESIIKNAHERATKLLKDNKNLLDNMARLLVERETIFSEEVDMIMEGRSVAEILEDMDARDKKRAENPFGEKQASQDTQTAPDSVAEEKEEKIGTEIQAEAQEETQAKATEEAEQKD